MAVNNAYLKISVE